MDKKKLFLTERDMDVFRALMKYHLTGSMIFDLSKTFKVPFASISNTRSRLNQLYQTGFLNRRQRLLEGRSKNENYYFLTKKSASLIPELEGVGKKDAIFQPRGISRQNHSFQISEAMVKMHKDIHLFRDICQMLGFIRENHFEAKGMEKRVIRPDGTILLNVNGENKLLFLEVDLSTEVVRSKRPNVRTFERKIRIYSEFKNHHFAYDKTIHRFAGIGGYRVITICKSVQRLENLLNLANSMNKSGMFWFTTTEWFLKKNCLFDRIWALPNGQLYPLF